VSRPRTIASLLALAGCPSSNAAPRAIHVAPDADDATSLVQAAAEARAGDRVVLHGGEYRVTSRIVVEHSGHPGAWIEIVAAPGERPILDVSSIPVSPPSGDPPFEIDQGALQIEGVGYVRVEGLTIRGSHNAGITVRDSHHVSLRDNTIDFTLASGIAVWDSDRDDEGTHHIEVMGNTITRANTWDVLPESFRPKEGVPPHEAITIAGAQHFEVAHNHVHHCAKEGIDVKETSKHGRVHHNRVHHVARQGIYVDAWHGRVQDVEIDANELHDNTGAGIVLGVEQGEGVYDVAVHHNVITDNLGSGILFARFIADGPRGDVTVEHNTIRHNGWGPAAEGSEYHWITGGIFLLSENLERVRIENNLVHDNAGFGIGVSEHYLADGAKLEAALAQRTITLKNNDIDPPAEPSRVVVVGGPGEAVPVYPVR